MYTEKLISQWVHRAGRQRHKVESVINGELITRCGRRLSVPGWSLSLVAGPDDLFCRQCGVG